MARISRKHQKIFAGAAANNGQFGSAQAGTKLLSNDLDDIQALAAFNNGWNDATISSQRLPTLEEMQALHFLTTSQIAYLFQEGLAEFSLETEYHEKSVVKKSGTYELYGSKINDNVGNALPSGVDDTNWTFLGDLSNLDGGGGELPVGSIYHNYSDSTNPATLLGYGTWVAIQDRMLIGAGGTYAAGATGGSATTTQTSSQIASHTHTIPIDNNSGGGSNLGAQSGDGGPIFSQISSSAGSGSAMTTISPYIAVYIWRRTA